MEIFEKIELLKTKGKEIANKKISNDTVKLLKDLTFEVLSKKLNNGCSTCYYEAYHEIINFDKNKLMEKLNCKYKLKVGVLLRTFGKPEMDCNYKTITDVKAEFHLNNDPFKIAYFESMPDEKRKYYESKCKDLATAKQVEVKKIDTKTVIEKEKEILKPIVTIPDEVKEIETEKTNQTEMSKSQMIMFLVNEKGMIRNQLKGKSKTEIELLYNQSR